MCSKDCLALAGLQFNGFPQIILTLQSACSEKPVGEDVDMHDSGLHAQCLTRGMPC